VNEAVGKDQQCRHKQIGNITKLPPERVTQETEADICGDRYPYVPGLRKDDWLLHDPKVPPNEEVRAICDDVKSCVQAC